MIQNYKNATLVLKHSAKSKKSMKSWWIIHVMYIIIKRSKKQHMKTSSSSDLLYISIVMLKVMSIYSLNVIKD